MIGKRLKKIREDKRFSAQALAEKTGLSRVTIWKIETGAVDPNVQTLTRLAHALGVDPVVFFGPNDDKSYHRRAS